jgi:hypothetical protein
MGEHFISGMPSSGRSRATARFGDFFIGEDSLNEAKHFPCSIT